MSLRRRFPIKLAIESFKKYQAKDLDIASLQRDISTSMSLLEGDIPKPVRETIVWAEAQLESIQFTVNTDKEFDEVAKVWRELDEVIARHLPPEEESEDQD